MRMAKRPRRSPSIKRSVCDSGADGGRSGMVSPNERCAHGTLSLPGMNWSIGAGPRLTRALVATAQLKVALAAVIGERTRLRAASIDAQLHAIDLAGRRAGSAPAALIRARLPRIRARTGILLCHGVDSPDQEACAGQAARDNPGDYPSLGSDRSSLRANRHRHLPLRPPRACPSAPTLTSDHAGAMAPA